MFRRQRAPATGAPVIVARGIVARGIVVSAAACCAVPYAFAQDLCLPTPPTTGADAAEQDPARTPGEPERVEITAGRIELGLDEGAEFSGNVEFRYGQRRLTAEQATYDRSAQRVEVSGRATYQDPSLEVFGEDATLDAQTEEVTFGSAGFTLPQRPARGRAEQITVSGERTVSFASVFFTTCPAEQEDWALLASRIRLDVDEGLGTARGVRLRFMGVPVMYSPYISFPIDDQRKSGFLTPHFGDGDRTGLDIAAPYYLNLAPNYDMTLEPRYLSRRGVQLNTEFRYLLPHSDGQLNLEYLPDDEATGDTRRYISAEHRTRLGSGWQITSAIEDVSDPTYFEDLGSGLSVTSQTHLNRSVDIAYHAPYWSLLTRFQNHQTIDPLIEPENRPYERLPQALFEGRWRHGRLGFDSTTELVNFDRDVGVTGWRLDSTQELSVRFGRPGMFLTPALALRQTNYWLNPLTSEADDSLSRTLPIASIDAGLRFERAAGERRAWTQTLEPRLLYVRIPFEAQDMLPVFDTIQPDFNLVQLFRRYQFVGPDRVADTEQVSFGLTTRLIETASGIERLTATLGQTRYLRTQNVALPGFSPNIADASDYVAEFSIGLSRTWNLDIGYQWNSETDSTARAETRFRFRPQPDRLFGFGYRYREGLLEQGDVSLVWPVIERWRIIGRYSYSFLDSKPLEQFVGLEYDACCWRLRVVGRNYISRRTGEDDSSIMLQLELKGLSQPDDSPEQLLDRGTLGYRPLNTPPAQ